MRLEPEILRGNGDGGKLFDRHFEVDPPERRETLSKSSRDECRERSFVTLESRQRIVDEIAIAAIDRDRDEGLPRRLLAQAFLDVGERYEVVSPRFDQREHAIQKFRRNLHRTIGLESLRHVRPYMTQHQNRTSAARRGSCKVMQPRRGQGREDQFVKRVAHGRSAVPSE